MYKKAKPYYVLIDCGFAALDASAETQKRLFNWLASGERSPEDVTLRFRDRETPDDSKIWFRCARVSKKVTRIGGRAVAGVLETTHIRICGQEFALHAGGRFRLDIEKLPR